MGAFCALGCLQFFLCEQLARLGWAGHYSLRLNYISDLGESSRCAAHALMNGSFFTQAVLIAASALLMPRRLVSSLTRALLLLSALGLALIATHPADIDVNMHITGARLHFACGALAMLAAGGAYLPRRRESGSGFGPGSGRQIAITLLFAGLAVAGDLLLSVGQGSAQQTFGVGLLERLAAYPLPLWLAFLGGDLLLQPAAAQSAPL